MASANERTMPTAGYAMRRGSGRRAGTRRLARASNFIVTSSLQGACRGRAIAHGLSAYVLGRAIAQARAEQPPRLLVARSLARSAPVEGSVNVCRRRTI